MRRKNHDALRIDDDPSKPLRVGTKWTSRDPRDHGRTVTIINNDEAGPQGGKYIVEYVRRSRITERTLLSRYTADGFNPDCQFKPAASIRHSEDTVTVYAGRQSGPVTLCGMHAQGNISRILAQIPSDQANREEV